MHCNGPQFRQWDGMEVFKECTEQVDDGISVRTGLHFTLNLCLEQLRKRRIKLVSKLSTCILENFQSALNKLNRVVFTDKIVDIYDLLMIRLIDQWFY